MAASRPREAVAVAEILRAQGAPAWEPRVEAQLLELSYRHVADLLDEAAQYAAHRSRDAPVTQADVRLAAQSALTHAFTDPLGGEELACIVARLNEAPLPDVPVRHGIVYPNESNLLATNFQVLAKPQVSVAAPPVAAPQFTAANEASTLLAGSREALSLGLPAVQAAKRPRQEELGWGGE